MDLAASHAVIRRDTSTFTSMIEVSCLGVLWSLFTVHLSLEFNSASYKLRTAGARLYLEYQICLYNFISSTSLVFELFLLHKKCTA